MLLSACLIAKDEEAHIAGCIASLHGLADEVVVLDTGSSDRTVEVAREHGARVEQAGWDGFAQARNRSLDLCNGDWILLIDADERAENDNADEVRQALSDDERAIAYRVRFELRTGLTPYLRLRIVRNDPRFRYTGVIHEVVDRSVQAAADRGEGSIAELPLTLRHLGGDDPMGKADRDVAYLRDACRKDPQNSFALAHLAALVAKIGTREQAEAAWLRAIEAGRRKQAPYERYDSLSFVGAIEYRLARGESADDCIEEAASLFPQNVQFTWHLARLRMSQNRPREAADLLTALLAQNGAPQENESFGYDERLFGEAGYDALANCRFRLGEYVEAERCFREAAEAAPDPAPYLAKAELCRILR